MLPVNQVYQGDCVELMGLLDDGSIDLTVTSPPYDNLRTYGGDWVFDFEGTAKELYRVTKKGGVVVWVVGDATIKGSETGSSFRQALGFMEVGFNLHDTMIYLKPNFSAVGALVTRYAPVFEYMFILTKEKIGTFNPIKDRLCKTAGKAKSGTIRQKDGSTKRMSNEGWIQPQYGQRYNVWEISPKTQKGHPAPFPEQLALDHITSWSNEGDTILDPFGGSGTTAIAALRLNRNYILMEMEPKYCTIARDRILAEVKQ